MSVPGFATSMSLYRTNYEKYPHYMPDGHGRDSYIIRHNGGMCHEREPNF